MTSTKEGFTERLAGYVANLKYNDLPADVIVQAKKIILDSLGCQVACALLENGKLIIQFGRALGGQAEASVLGSSYRTSAMDAAFINGTLGHGDEIDESLERSGHTSSVIVPAALACGERARASGKDMITAVVAGYDVAGRLANAGIARSNLVMGLSGVFWGVAAACNILQLESDKTRIAFGLAMCQAGGFYDVGSEAKHMAKSLMCGIQARSGVTAALLAQMGYDGPRFIFDGNDNVLRSLAGDNYDQGELIKNLGSKFTIMDTCVKLYAAGHPIHAPVDGLLKILAREGISAEDIQSVTVRQPKGEHQVVNNRDMPDINIQYCMAVTAFDRQLTWDQYTPERLHDTKVADLKNRVLTVHDPKLDERKRITKAHSAEVELETKDGRRFSERVDYPPGDPARPASQEDVDEKVMHYTSKVLGRDKTQKLVEAVKKLDEIGDLNQLGRLLRLA